MMLFRMIMYPAFSASVNGRIWNWTVKQDVYQQLNCGSGEVPSLTTHSNGVKNAKTDVFQSYYREACVADSMTLTI